MNKDIIILILNNLQLKDILISSQINKEYNTIVKKHKWNHLIIRIKINNLINVLNTFNFINYDLSYTNITDEIVKYLSNSNYHTLNLSWCQNITDDSVKLLSNCHTLDLSNCCNITDESVKLLSNCHTLYLHKTKIKNKCINFLKLNNVNIYG